MAKSVTRVCVAAASRGPSPQRCSVTCGLARMTGRCWSTSHRHAGRAVMVIHRRRRCVHPAFSLSRQPSSRAPRQHVGQTRSSRPPSPLLQRRDAAFFCFAIRCLDWSLMHTMLPTSQECIAKHTNQCSRQDQLLRIHWLLSPNPPPLDVLYPPCTMLSGQSSISP